ncbi:MAG: hypothetical protein CSA85_00100 [Alphaproteobacteria bacterium]|nr:MAG: hypothetical protein CSA85_00100 [Alphaproteobacteria bacterium]
MQTIAECWGSTPPDWVVRLAEECEASSQRQVAARLDRSGALVNQVLKNKYKGDLAAVEDCVRGVFMNGVIDCPALGAIPSNECHDWRKKARQFGNANMLRVRMFRACTHCPRNAKGES